MKNRTKKIISVILAILLFMSCPHYVYASEHGGGGGTDHNSDFITDSGTINIKDDGVVMYYIEYILSQIGAVIFDHDITKVMANDQTMKEYISKGKFDANKNTVTFPKETVIYVKETFDDYAKEHEPYYMVNTLTLDDFTGNSYAGSKIMYDTAKNLLNDSSSGVIAFGAYYSTPTQMFFVDIGNDFRNVSAVNPNNKNYVTFYNNETWGQSSYTAYEVQLTVDDVAIKTTSEFKEKAKYKYSYGTNYNYPIGYRFKVYIPGSVVPSYSYDCRFPSNSLSLVTKEKRRIRVFNTYGDFQNFTLGKRKVYYTENYYNYVPEDLSVSIDDLEKSVDDLQKVIDELLKQIQDDTSEKEIEELLKQILDEIRNGQGSGGGGGSGGGDVTVDIDLSTTNGLLSKILAKVTQIFDKMSSSAGQTMDSVVTAIEDLGKMLKKYLKAITGDLDDIKDKLDVISEQEFADKSESFLKETETSFSEIAEVAKTKFPLSIPNDINNLLSALKGKPPEQEAQAFNASFSAVNVGKEIYTYGDKNLITVYEGGAGKTVQRSDMGAPVFTLPLVITSVGWDYSIVVDLSEFQLVADLSRSMFTLIYIYGIIILSIKVIGLWGELVD